MLPHFILRPGTQAGLSPPCPSLPFPQHRIEQLLKEAEEHKAAAASLKKQAEERQAEAEAQTKAAEESRR